MIITPEEYLKEERIEDVLVGYSVPPKAKERLRNLQEALYQIRENSIRIDDSPILEGILLFGSFTRGKLEPGDIDFFPFFDFSSYVPEEQPEEEPESEKGESTPITGETIFEFFKTLTNKIKIIGQTITGFQTEEDVKRSNQAHDFIERFGELYNNAGGTPHLEVCPFYKRYNYYKCYIDCATDDIFFGDWRALRKYFSNAIEPDKPFRPRVNHILGPKRLKEQFKRVTRSLTLPSKR